ncbi:MAG: hypothetical protein A3D28_06465 [Omnitrophica bacterium RIFCSPHIGHO2_02_FULL_63_14]|nr:MAG: hypothetical protein A3D28_06465 [Omnitrophica bacterium RIFCSPHIGHO2_02_FULL_63_14]
MLRRSLICLIAFFFLAAGQLFADELSAVLREDLSSYLKGRGNNTSLEERSPAETIKFPYHENGSTNPSLFVLPIRTVYLYEESLYLRKKYELLYDFGKAMIDNKPDDVFTMERLGDASQMLKRVDEAVKYYEKSGSLWGKYNLWGIYKFDSKNDAVAGKYLDEFHKELSGRPAPGKQSLKKSLEIYLWEASNHFFNEAKDVEYADKYLSMLLQISPDHELGRFHKDLCLLDKAMRSQDDLLLKNVLDNLNELIKIARDERVINQAKRVIEDYSHRN